MGEVRSTGYCVYCGRRLALRMDGTVWTHKLDGTGRRISCPGSRALPELNHQPLQESTYWRLAAVPGRPQLNVQLALGTRAEAVVSAVEQAALRQGIRLIRLPNQELVA